TLAKSRLPNGKSAMGQAWRIQYQKDFSATGTAFNLASYRYASRNYYEFSELNQYAGKKPFTQWQKRDGAGVAHSVSERFQRYRHRL
ncbi:fimbria/pilus outer membrane usher protein, partial [Klebsiella pneumoniae]|uniref:fimbria/pilus outer membrane usher protein n=1 Tax=Klebsiella pneumoniae TaxID=573 RepID=UPI00211CBF90